MKRRLFLTSTGVAATFISTGFASTSAVLSPAYPWRFNPDLDQKLVQLLDDFSARLMNELQDKPNAKKLMKNLVAPINIISQDPEKGLFVYKSASGAEVHIQNGEKMMVKILNSQAI